MNKIFHLLLAFSLIFPNYFFIPFIIYYFFKLFVPLVIDKLKISVWASTIFLFGLTLFIYYYFDNEDINILLTETKILLPVFLLVFKYKLKIDYNLLSKYFLFIFGILFLHALISLNIIFRFTDYYQNYTGMISIYFGFLLIFLIYNVDSKKISYLLILSLLITGSGSAILASVPVIFYKFRKLIKGRFMFLFIIIILTSLFIYILLITQVSRGRSFEDFEAIDRYILFTSYLNYLYNEFSFKLLLFGNGLGENMNFLLKYMDNKIFEGYIINESEFISGKNLHNEFFRIFSNFGLPFLIIIMLQIKKIFPKPLFLSFLIACLFNSVIYPTFFSILILLKQNKNDIQITRI